MADIEGHRIDYPRQKKIDQMTTIQAYNQVIQALLNTQPGYSMLKLRGILGRPNSPDALSRRLRSSLPYSFTNNHHKRG